MIHCSEIQTGASALLRHLPHKNLRGLRSKTKTFRANKLWCTCTVVVNLFFNAAQSFNKIALPVHDIPYIVSRDWKPRNDKLVPVSTAIAHTFQHSSFVRIPPTYWMREILPTFAIVTPKAMLFVINECLYFYSLVSTINKGPLFVFVCRQLLNQALSAWIFGRWS
jgi:hypothetical protein